MKHLKLLLSLLLFSVLSCKSNKKTIEFSFFTAGHTYGRALGKNFWSKIEPFLRNQKKPVFLFAGDMGAFPKEFRKQKNTIEYFYYNYDNITFIGTGMGGGVKDNFVIVDILKNKTVDFRLIHKWG
tara:strand:- start:6563 stop:6940 length:378 start_codon:yes stop_codon:yes gene_type:complete